MVLDEFREKRKRRIKPMIKVEGNLEGKWWWIQTADGPALLSPPMRFEKFQGIPNLDWIPTPLPMTPGCLVKLNPALLRRMK